MNSQIAQVIGEEKELRDAQGGSGFSFRRLRPPIRQGTRFGELATATPKSAQTIAKSNGRSSRITNRLHARPQNFARTHGRGGVQKTQYGAINSEAYLKVSKQIDGMIAQTPIYGQVK